MNIKTVLTVLVLTLTSALYTSAQKVKIKRDKVFLNKEHLLNYEKISTVEVSFYSIDNQEILHYSYSNNKTQYNQADDYFSLNFIGHGVKVKTRLWSRISGLGIRKAMQKLIIWLLKEKVITDGGVVDQVKLSAFFDKYNEY